MVFTESWSSCSCSVMLLFQSAIAPNQRIGRTVVIKQRLARAFKFGNDSVRKNHSQFDSPLIERVDPPDHALRKHAVLIQRDQSAKGIRRETLGKNGIGRAITFKRTMLDQPIRSALRPHLISGLAE